MIQFKKEKLRYCQYCYSQTTCDCVERMNCPKAGRYGHIACGICKHSIPKFNCPKCINKGIRVGS